MRSKKIILFLVLILTFTSFLMACNKENTSEPNEPNIENKDNDSEAAVTKQYQTLIVDDYNNVDVNRLNMYEIDIIFNPEEKSYNGNQNVKYVNNENVELNEVYFHLYPNAFRSKETAPFLFDDYNAAYPNGFEPGFIDITKLKLNDELMTNAKFVIDNTILKVPLNTPLKPGESVDIYMEYSAKLPPCQDRFGYGDKTFNLGNWYPIAAVYDESGWNLDPYYRIGDPFYSDTSNYKVNITAPKEYIVASSGNILSEDVKKDDKTWEIEAKLMRDFAWVISKHFIIEQKDVDGTLVKNYFLEDNKDVNEFAANVAYDSIKTYNANFGKYPFGQYSVVATSFPSGMEYPGIVFIGENAYTGRNTDWLRVVIAHETGHQWWYSVVGNDEIDEAWLDESLTTYSEVIFYDEVYGEKAGNNYYNSRIKSSYERRKGDVAALGADEIVSKPLSKFKNWTDYGALVYSKGATFIGEIEAKYGEETLYNILKEYYTRYRFLNATTEDFIKVCEYVTGDDFTDLANLWLYNK